jgi:hypothetical protein
MTDTCANISEPDTQPQLLWLWVHRQPLRKLGWRRLLVGGRVSDLGRLPWYFAIFLMGTSALWAGHMDWSLGTKQTIKSSIGWAKGWALLTLFPLLGVVLPIRREILTRAQCTLGLWTSIIAPVLLIAPILGLPECIFTSPLKAIGGPGPEIFRSVFTPLTHRGGRHVGSSLRHGRLLRRSWASHFWTWQHRLEADCRLAL